VGGGGRVGEEKGREGGRELGWGDGKGEKRGDNGTWKEESSGVGRKVREGTGGR